METPPEPSLESLARRGAWRAILDRVGATGGAAPPNAPSSSSIQPSTSSNVAAAWRVAALVKLRNFASAELELERLGDRGLLDSTSREEIPFALLWCAADLPARVGRPSDGAAAFARLAVLSDRRAREEEHAGGGGGGGEKGTRQDAEKQVALWRERAEAACWAAAGIHARSDDPRAARAMARAALNRRAARRGRCGGGGGAGASGPAWCREQPWEPPLAAGAEALSAAARLELASGEPSEARRLFVAAAAARARAAADVAAAGGGEAAAAVAAAAEAEASRAAALLRLSAGDASRAAAGFGALASRTPVDSSNEALCLLLSGDASRARAVALEGLLLAPACPASAPESSSSPSPLLFSGAALRTAVALADLAPPAAARAARDALFDAVQAAGAPDDLDASFLAAA